MNTLNMTWLKAAGIRAVKTVAQTAVATIGTAAALWQEGQDLVDKLAGYGIQAEIATSQ